MVDSDRYLLTWYRYYIEMNPVRAGMTDSPAGYRWSRVHHNAVGHPDRVVVPHAGYLALGDENDADHTAANAWLEANTEPLVTTDYVIDELVTLMKMRGEFRRALRVGASVFAEEITQVAWVLPNDIQQAWDRGGLCL